MVTELAALPRTTLGVETEMPMETEDDASISTVAPCVLTSEVRADPSVNTPEMADVPVPGEGAIWILPARALEAVGVGRVNKNVLPSVAPNSSTLLGTVTVLVVAKLRDPVI